jgi:GxxExxY protein
MTLSSTWRIDVEPLAARLVEGKLTGSILDGAIEVHRALGPGLLESAYHACLARELRLRDLRVELEVPVPLVYKDQPVECGFRLDLVVEGTVVVEVKAVERILPLHEAQLLTYLKLFKRRVGLLINFNATPLRSGFRRLVL